MMAKSTRSLSKSKLLAYRQCPRRLWLEVHRPELNRESQAARSAFEIGHRVGDVARRIYDPKGKAILIDAQSEGFDTAYRRSRELLSSFSPIYEGGFATGRAHAFADIMLPKRGTTGRTWKVVEVKSSAEIKDYQRDDAAIQAYVLREAGVPLSGMSLAHIDSSWLYPGKEKYDGLLKEVDVTSETRERSAEVEEWLDDAHAVVRRRSEPKLCTGRHCSEPYTCGFYDHCQESEPKAKYPVEWLPRIQKKELKDYIERNRVIDMRKIPEALLNERQKMVRACTISGDFLLDRAASARALASHRLPAYFLDFETIQFAVPIWKGTRPFQNIPFQFSLHRLGRGGALAHRWFIDLTGDDPSRAFAQELVEACSEPLPVFVYGAAFEKARIDELANRFPDLRHTLKGIHARIVDLLPVARQCCYHPDQQGRWSLKALLPALFPELDYANLHGVQDGGMAMDAYREAASPQTSASRKAEIREQLLAYCERDTFGLVKIWRLFAGRNDARS